MNKEKWTRPTVSFAHLGVKLAEETGEVCSEISDAAELHWASEEKLDAIIAEAQHVLFIANVIISRAHEMKSDVKHERNMRRIGGETKHFHVTRPDFNGDNSRTVLASGREQAKRKAHKMLGGDPERYIVEPQS